jgi:hypothetical protein
MADRFISYLRRHYIGLLALCVVLTGTAYAASLPNDSVGTRQLKDGAVSAKKIKRSAVSSSKVRSRSLLAKDFKAGQLPRGPKGPKGDKGDPGDPGATALAPLASNRTIRGAVGGDFHAYTNEAVDFGIDVTLQIPAANALGDDQVFVNVAGWQGDVGQTPPTTTDTDPGCTGNPTNPTAAAGKVCVYVSEADDALNLEGSSVLFGTGASPYGFKLKWDTPAVVGGTDTFVDATWAYTAP